MRPGPRRRAPASARLQAVALMSRRVALGASRRDAEVHGLRLSIGWDVHLPVPALLLEV